MFFIFVHPVRRGGGFIIHQLGYPIDGFCLQVLSEKECIFFNCYILNRCIFRTVVVLSSMWQRYLQKILAAVPAHDPQIRVIGPLYIQLVEAASASPPGDLKIGKIVRMMYRLWMNDYTIKKKNTLFKTSAPIRILKCFFQPLLGIHDRPTDRPIDRQTGL